MGLATKTTAWSDSLWEHFLHTDQGAYDAMHKHTVPAQILEGFAQDIFAQMYLRSPPDLSPGSTWAHKVLAHISRLPAWDALRQQTQESPTMAGTVTLELIETCMDMLNHSGTPEDFSRLIRALGQDTEQLNREAAAQQEEFAILEGCLASPDQGLHPKTITEEKRLITFQRIMSKSPAMKRIIDNLGRLTNIMGGRPTTTKRGRDSISGITRGGDIPRLLPSAVVGLRSTDQWRKRKDMLDILSNQALQYQIKGKEELGKGPLVILVDQSGSMREHDKYLWAMGACLAAIKQMAQQRRDCQIFTFNTRVVYSIEMRRKTAYTQRIDRLLSLLTIEPQGDTEYEDPLRHCIAHLEHEMPRADLMIITDGLAKEISPRLLESINTHKKAGLCLQAITMDIEEEQSEENLVNLRTFCDTIYAITKNPSKEDEAEILQVFTT